VNVVQRVCFALFGLFVFTAAPTVAYADPILMTASGSGSLSELFPSGGTPAAPGTESSSALTALDLSGDPLDAVLFEVPTGTELPAADSSPSADAAVTSLGPVDAYNVGGINSSSPFLIGLGPISNVSFQSGTGPAPTLPPGIGRVSVPEPATLLLLGPAAALALWRRRRGKAAR
jgi:hypothetical protein